MGRRSWLVVVDGQESCIPMRRREEAAKIINPTLMDVPSSGSEMPVALHLDVLKLLGRLFRTVKLALHFAALM